MLIIFIITKPFSTISIYIIWMFYFYEYILNSTYN